MKYYVETKDGATRYYSDAEFNVLHRENGPAVECADGYKAWHLNGKVHRTDGPAVECANGSKFWFLNDKVHRTDGPAAEYANGSKFWFLNGKLHRTDGPAIEHTNGHKYWYINGVKLTEEEFNARTVAPCTDKGVEMDIRVGSSYVLRNGDVIDILSEETGQGFWGRSKNRYHVPGRMYLGSEQHFWRSNGDFSPWSKNHPLDIVGTEYGKYGMNGYKETLYVKECDRPLNHHHNSSTRVR